MQRFPLQSITKGCNKIKLLFSTVTPKNYPGDYLRERKLFGSLLDEGSISYNANSDNLFRYMVDPNDDLKNKLQVVSFEQRGLGVIATLDIKVGDIIIKEHPLLVFPRLKGVNSSILSKFELLNVADQVSYIGLSHSNHYNTPSKTIEGIKMNNCVTLSSDGHADTQAAIFLLIHRLNHACIPNASFSYNHDDKVGYITALEDIDTGTEICLSYFKGDFLSSTERHSYLSAYNISPCLCSLCTRSGSDIELSNQRRVQIQEYQNTIIAYAQDIRDLRDVNTLNQSVHNAIQLEKLVILAIADVASVEELLKSEGLLRPDNLNWINLFLFWITDDSAYACYAYLYNSQSAGYLNSVHILEMIPMETRNAGLKSHFQDGRKCSYEAFNHTKSAFSVDGV